MVSASCLCCCSASSPLITLLGPTFLIGPAEALFGRAPFASRSFAELEEKIRSDQAIEVIKIRSTLFILKLKLYLFHMGEIMVITAIIQPVTIFIYLKYAR